MVRSLVIGCLLVVSFSISRAQWGGLGGGAGGEQKPAPMAAPGPRVVFDLLAFKQEGTNPIADSTRMDLYLAVDYNSLEFLYAIDKYFADYSVTVQIMAKGNLLLDRYAAYTVLEPVVDHRDRVQYKENRADAQQLSFLLPPGTAYTMRLSVRDHASRTADRSSGFDTSFDFNVRDFAGNERSSTPSMSDLMMYRERIKMSVVPSIGPDVTSLDDRSSTNRPSSGIFAELYNMPADSTLGIVSEIVPIHGGRSDDKNSYISREATTLHIVASNVVRSTASISDHAPPSIPVTPLFAPVSFDGLWTGYYTLHTYVLPSAQDTVLTDPTALETRAITSAERPVSVTIAQGIPIASGDLDQAIEQLGVIATGSEWDSLSRARTSEQKRDAILDFWRKKNGLSVYGLSHAHASRAMEVFYSRVEYANAHFGTSFQAGWKSDRGHVYIALGPPDLIDSHPQGIAQAYGGLQAPYEAWQYSSRNLRYTFVDEYMLSDYRLRGAFPPEGTFFWQ